MTVNSQGPATHPKVWQYKFASGNERDKLNLIR
jgi:hypothetical protein